MRTFFLAAAGCAPLIFGAGTGTEGGWRATVIANRVAIHAQTSATSRVLRMAARGEVFTVAYSVTADEVDWCGLGGAQRGYAECKYLARERPAQTAEAAAPPVLNTLASQRRGRDLPASTMQIPGQAALIRAAKLGDVAAIELAIENGALAAGRDRDGRTALFWAASMGHVDAAKELIQASSDINAPDDLGWTPLAAAVRAQHPEMAELLLERGAEVNARDNQQRTPLMYAAEHGDLRMVRDLLAKGGDPNASDALGQTPLTFAVLLHNPAAAEALMAAGADVCAWDLGGRSVLIHAVLSDIEQTAMIRLLVQHGANVHARDNQGRTALALALSKGYTATAQVLEQAGATGW